MKNNEKGFFEHVGDLTSLIIKTGIIFVLSTLVVFFFTPKLFQLIINETLSGLDIQLSTIRPAEILLTEIKLAALGGLILGSPIIVPLIWSYLRSALTKKERKIITISLLPSILLFVTGFTFSLFVILPIATHFLYNLALSFEITPIWTISSYLSLVLSLGFAFGIAFELPIVVFVLERLGVVGVHDLKRSRKYVFVSLLIIAAFITPPDVVSQLLLAVPLILLYELSVLIIRIVPKLKKGEG